MPDRTLFGPDPLTLPDAQALAATLRVLADPTRLQILSLLATHPAGLFTYELVEHVGKAQPTVTHHVNQLRAHSLVEGERDGAVRLLTLNRAVLTGLAEALHPGGDLR